MRTKVTAVTLGLVMALGPPGQAFALELPAAVQPAYQKFHTASGNVNCVGTEYDAPPPSPAVALKGRCQACARELDAQLKKLETGLQAAVGQNSSSTLGGITSIFGAGLGSTQQTNQTSAQAGTTAGATAAAGKAGAANAAKAAFSQCSTPPASCSAIGSQETMAKQATQACVEGVASSDGVVAEQTAKGMTMSEMAQMAGSAAQLLGPLAQMMQGGQKSGSGNQSGVSGGNGLSPYSYTPSSSSGLSENDDSSSSKTTNTAQTSPTSSSKLGGNDKAASSSVSAENSPSSAGSGFYTSPNAKSGGGGGSDSAHQSLTSDPSKLSDSLAYGNSGNSGQGYGASFGGSGAGSSMLGGGSGNSSGASKMGDKDAIAKAAGDVGAFELPGGGGSSRPAFLGLKSAPLDLGAGGDGPLAGAEGLESLGVDLGEGGGRELASQANDIHAEGEASIFHLVKAKYVEIKKRGNI